MFILFIFIYQSLNNNLPYTPPFTSALSSYCFRDTEDSDGLGLQKPEVAALMNLVATDTAVDEAKTLIPSLGRFPEAAIDEILDLIRSTMIRIVS